MGLDSVELLVAVEDRFGIVIKDEDAERVRTIDDLTSVVLTYLRTKPTIKCKTQHVFYRFRRQFSHRERKLVAISRPIRGYIYNHRDYRELEKSLGLQLPDLQLTPWLSWSLTVGTILVITTSCLFMFKSITGFVACLSGIYLWIKFSEKITSRFSTVVPDLSIKEFIESTTGINYKMIYPEFHSVNEVRLLLKRVVSDAVGCDIREIHDHSDLRKDLGID